MIHASAADVGIGQLSACLCRQQASDGESVKLIWPVEKSMYLFTETQGYSKNKGAIAQSETVKHAFATQSSVQANIPSLLQSVVSLFLEAHRRHCCLL